MDELGKDRNPYRAGFLQFVGVAGSKAEAMELYREPAEYFYGNCLHVAPRFAIAPGYQDEEPASGSASSPRWRRRPSGRAPARSPPARSGPRASYAGGDAMTMEEIVEKGYVVVGSPDEVAEELLGLSNDLNVGHLMLLLQFGNMDADTCRYNTELFAKEVTPQLRSQFEDWENPWWPKPLTGDHRALPRPVSRGERPMEERDPTSTRSRSTATPAGCGRRARASRSATSPGLSACPAGRRSSTPWPSTAASWCRRSPGYPGGTGHEDLDDVADWVSATLDLLDAVGARRGRPDRRVGGRHAGRRGRRLLAPQRAPARARRPVRRSTWPRTRCRTSSPPTRRPCPAWSAPTAPHADAQLARPEGVDEVEWSVVCGRAIAAGARLLWPMCDTRLARRLHRITAPTLVVWGEDDAVIDPAYAKRFDAGIGGPTETYIVPGAGHHADWDRPTEVAERVEAFLLLTRTLST